MVSSATLEWAEVLGADFVISEDAALRAVEAATFETTQRIPVILRPGTVDQLCEIVRIAARNGIALYPVSSGKNWGYGSRVPVVTGCALIDLSRLDQITGFNEELGYVTVQPGVTQQALFAFLRQRQSRLWLDATGSSPDCSLIGNAMERGFGHTPYGEHFANVCGLEAVLANGEVIRTGFAGLHSARAGEVYKWGVGPSLDGLFSQSNFGIVTGMTIWLMPAPEYFQAFFFQCDDEAGLARIVEALRPLRMDGTVRSAVHIGNDYKVLAGIQQFPWGEPMPLPRERMQALRKQLKFSRWSGSGAFYGTRGQVAECRRLLRGALRGKVGKLQFLDDRMLSLASRFKGVYRAMTGLDLTRTLELLQPVYGLLKGIPTAKTLGSAYWRKRQPVPPDPDPDRDRCGVLWLAPVAPMTGNEAAKLVEWAERTLLAHGFEPLVSITLLTERSLACIISITYDRDEPGEDAKAMACYRDLHRQFDEAGYYSYRLGIAGMELYRPDAAYADLLRAIKQAVDPNRILAPGRYLPAGERLP
ncbi:MAG TPA: FAD-binding oxidoreductase [Bryobacteraceae bacterium]|nr:FAD-binding oxidoreductase [Bryobacteraceae bacterium]